MHCGLVFGKFGLADAKGADCHANDCKVEEPLAVAPGTRLFVAGFVCEPDPGPGTTASERSCTVPKRDHVLRMRDSCEAEGDRMREHTTRKRFLESCQRFQEIQLGTD